MLLPIRLPSCHRALSATQDLQITLMRWLCDSHTSINDFNRHNVRALHHSEIVGDWLVWLLFDHSEVRNAVQRIIQTISVHKNNILQWYNTTLTIKTYFDNPAQTGWPVARPICSNTEWDSVKILLQSFYKTGFDKGLPFDEDGFPTNDQKRKLTRKKFVEIFRNENNKFVCSYCDGELSNIEVDHWIGKGEYPGLSVYPLNLIPSCGECNSAAHKGQNPTLTSSLSNPFSDWFHPYLNQAFDRFNLQFDSMNNAISINAVSLSDQTHFANLNKLLDLTDRWNLKFENEYQTFLEISSECIRSNDIEFDNASICNYIRFETQKLSYERRTKAHFLVRNLFYNTLLNDILFFELFKEGIQRAQFNG